MTNPIGWIQEWYEAQCNGEWEHKHGISIQTLDNPGWVVRIDLRGTALQDVAMQEVVVSEVNHSGLEGDQNWLHCKVEDSCFVGAGGPASLIEICEVFKNWVESNRSASPSPS
jgi:hypothetical protein